MTTRERRARKLGIPIDQLPDGRGKNPASWGHAKRGSEHPRWNDGRMLNENGYVKIRVGKDHPLADPNGYAYEHLVIWCAAGNCRPAPGFDLHHDNEDRADNRLSNLKLRLKRDHAREHGRCSLCESAVVAIRTCYAAGQASQQELAKRYGVPHQRISKIIKGRAWRDVGGPVSAIDNRSRDPLMGRVVGKKRAGAKLDGVDTGSSSR